MHVDDIAIAKNANWRAGLLLRVSPRGALNSCEHPAFRTLTTPGTLAPPTQNVGWNLHFGADRQEDSVVVRVLSNGMLIADSTRPSACTSLWITGMQSCAGRAYAPFKPSLFSAAHTPQQIEDGVYLQAGDVHVVMLTKTEGESVRFALGYDTRSRTDAEGQARAAWAVQVDEWAAAELRWRYQHTRDGRHPGQGEPIRLSSLESMEAALRFSKGFCSGCWSESNTQPGCLVLNELWPLVQAWSIVDPSIARQLLFTALDTQDTDGFIPAWVHPDGQSARDEMMWPTLAAAAAEVLRVLPQEALAARILPCVARYLFAAEQRFCTETPFGWTSAEEAFIPEVFDEGLTSVDGAALLLNECDTFLAWAKRFPDTLHAGQADRIRTLGNTLREALGNQLWSADTSTFHDRLQDGTLVRRVNIGCWLPLLTSNWPDPIASAAPSQFERVFKKEDPDTFRLWEPWKDDPEKAPPSALHLFFVTHAAHRQRTSKRTHPFEEQLLSALNARWDDAHQVLRAMDQEDNARTTGNDPITASLYLALDQPEDVPEANEQSSPVLLWLERHRHFVTFGSLGSLLLALIVIVLVYLFRSDPTGADMEALSSIAERHYHDGHYEEAIQIYQNLLEYLPHNPVLKMRLGNARFRQGNYQQAEQYYRLAMTEDLPSPDVLRNLAIALFRQRQYTQSAHYFQQLIDLHAPYYPQLAGQAYVALEILERYAPSEEKEGRERQGGRGEEPQ